jgi:hypothetical protein
MSRPPDARTRFPFNLLAALAIVASLVLVGSGTTVPGARAQAHAPLCGVSPQLCTETTQPWNYKGQYTGHDEPSLLFYSSKPGSGNSNLYQLTLPTEPTNLPAQDGSGATWNFMLHPAFWFGMAMCDDQSAPDPGKACPADSDSNIHTNTNPHAVDYLGNTPGSGFMEMQFYPPGWAQWPPGVSCSATQWCAALNIDSLSENDQTGTINNNDCLNNAGYEYVNFAFITKSGVPQPNSPPDPYHATYTTYTPNATADLFMNPGDRLTVNMHDTANGFQVVINDLTTGQSGSMTASAANGFGHPMYQPDASTCTEAPYTFHPMYSTSSPSTRVLWAAHSYNVAFSDEIGHFEYCAAGSYFSCSQAGASENDGQVDGDDNGCLSSNIGTSTTNITGCLGVDGDFDGPEYAHNWPGSDPNHASDLANHGTPITFSSPLFTGPGISGMANYDRVAFETDLPRIESSDISWTNNCNRQTGSGCVNPPNGASFYPIFMTANLGGQCMWQEGDVNLPNLTNTFGGSSTTEYGGLQSSSYPVPGGSISLIENNHSTLNNNPCPASGNKSG